MRKFTKEISALLATVAVGATVSSATAASADGAARTDDAAIEQNDDSIWDQPTAGVNIATPVTEPIDTYLMGEVAPPYETEPIDTYLMGEVAPPYETEPIDTYLMGDVAPPYETEPIYEAGVLTTSTEDNYATQINETTTTTASAVTLMIGTVVNDTTTTTTATETDDSWFAGGIMAPNYGDANGDGNLSVADSVAILQYIGNKDKYGLTEYQQELADCYNPGDGITPMDALTIQKIDAGELTRSDLPVIPDCENGTC